MDNKVEFVEIEGLTIPVYSFNTVIVGTGCAGYNAADTLFSLGQKDIAIITEGINMGTSRNTGSDKQTYYKLTMSGNTPDSVFDMAKTLFDGGSMHGDIALIEAAMSARSFYKLVNIGVNFPHNEFGEYVGYKTDHDPRQRATSCGPLTSKMMTEKLEESVRSKNILVLDGLRVIGIVVKNSCALGLLAIDSNPNSPNPYGFTLINSTNTVYATGGPSGIYHSSVYPQSQTCAMGTAFLAGAKGINLTESQYGIASIDFRWNLSGTYQQVLPAYISTDENMENPREFLSDYFDNPTDLLNAIFLKGYQWPFDPRKIANNGSSKVDIAVYEEKRKNRRIFLDFRINPSCLAKNGLPDFSKLGEEAKVYLEKSNALLKLPIERLRKMNDPAYRLYLANGIDLEKERLEIDVCAQHNNGGLLGNMWWESNLKHFFPVGEVNGTFGVYRPGGSALNSTQTGSSRAAMFIRQNYTAAPAKTRDFSDAAKETVADSLDFIRKISDSKADKTSPLALREKYQKAMDLCGAFIRPVLLVSETIAKVEIYIQNQVDATYACSRRDILDAFINRDILITQFAYMSAINEYIKRGGKSRGSYLICNDADLKNYKLEDGRMNSLVCETEYIPKEIRCDFGWGPVRPLPDNDSWFENIYNRYNRNEIVKQYIAQP